MHIASPSDASQDIPVLRTRSHGTAARHLHQAQIITYTCAIGEVCILAFAVCRDADVQAEIAQLRTQLLQADQARELVQEQLAKEKEEREHAQRKVQTPCTCLRQQDPHP